MRLEKRRLHTRFFLLLLLTSASGANATDVSAVVGEETLQYSFHPSEVLPWIRGERSGPVPDEKGAVAIGLEEFLSKAQRSIDLALYGVEKQTWLLSTLKQLRENGRQIRAVVDQERGQAGQWRPENFTYPSTYLLPSILGPANVVPDVNLEGEVRTSSIMHNKFIVLDSDRVWTGSANFSATCLGASYNANVSIEINSPALAQVYRREFAQMFTQRLFSTSKKQAVREVPTINYKDGSQIRALFSPQDDTIGRGILPFINQARTKLDVAMFYLTEEAVANAMIAARRRGVQVRLIIDAVGAGNQASKHYMLRDAGIHVRVENWGGKMHMKSAVADGKHTIIGSMNWTFTGNARNDENILLIYNNSRLATEMSDYFESLWETIPEDQVARSLRPESEYSTNSCSDGADNDHDQLIDAEDPECQ